MMIWFYSQQYVLGVADTNVIKVKGSPSAKRPVSTSTETVKRLNRGQVCWNCDSTGHGTYNCSQPRNEAKIAAFKAKWKADRDAAVSVGESAAVVSTLSSFGKPNLVEPKKPKVDRVKGNRNKCKSEELHLDVSTDHQRVFSLSQSDNFNLRIDDSLRTNANLRVDDL
jgi:hypothetical protein